ncbi:MAG: DUF4430 domain-containing protein, partial [Anaerovoracaceae bacterium]|nr:DUF4430 domain-containing protein [Anaerovoracaceae bacterium]
MNYKKNGLIRLNGIKKSMAFILMLAMVITSLGISGWGTDEAYAALVYPQAENAINSYYNGSQNMVLDDWEELAAVYSYLEGYVASNSYRGGVDISAYVLPQTGTGAGGLFAALMKGDSGTATELAKNLVAASHVITAGGVYQCSTNILALEAFNRSNGVIPVTYNTTRAIDYLLEAREIDGGYKAWGEISYDTAGMVLTALSLPVFSEYPNIEDRKIELVKWIKAGQSPSGAFQSFYLGVGSDNANTTAIVLYGLLAAGEKLDKWTTSPALGLVDSGLYNESDGWFTSWSGPWNDFATKQSTLALVDANKGNSFYANVELNSIHYISTTMQLIKDDGTYLEKSVTVPSGSSLNFVASKVSGSAITEGLNYYEDGEEVSLVADNSTILAVAAKFDNITYLSYEDSKLGVARVNVPFGGSADFNIKNLELSTGSITALQFVSVDVNGDSIGDVVSNESGKVTIIPIDEVTYLNVLEYTYDNNTRLNVRRVPSDSAILPAEIIMATGGSQTKTVSVRIEGPTDHFAYYTAYDVVGDGSKQLTVEEAVNQVMDASSIEYAYIGGYLTTVGGIYSAMYGGHDGWCYYINNSGSNSGMAGQVISDGDEIVLYYGFGPGWGTDLVRLESSISGSAVTLTVLNGTTSVPGVTISWNRASLPEVTDENGKVTINNVSSGTYSVQISKTNKDGVPLVVRLPSGTAITITDSGDSSQEEGSGLIETAEKVFLTVKGLGGKVLYPNTSQSYYVGITARDVLDNTPLSITGSRAYVTAIDGLNEFEHGPNSGWLYTVNGGVAGTTPSNSKRLSIGDEVLWYYTSDYKKDSGSSAWKKDEEKTSELVAKEDGKGSATVEVSKADMDKLIKDGGALKAKSSIATIEMDAATLKGLGKEMGKDLEIRAKKVDITEKDDISQEMKDKIGDRPVLDLTVMSGTKQISQFDGSVRVSIPYTLKDGEDPSTVIIYLIKDNGEIEVVKNAEFDPATGEVKFTTSHFSLYGIGYKELGFSDIKGHWAKDHISYLAARDYITGMSKDHFAPEGTLTRGQFVQLLANLANVDLKKYGSTEPSSINDIKSTDWFAPAVAWAVEQGIVTGITLPDGTTSFY